MACYAGTWCSWGRATSASACATARTGPRRTTVPHSSITATPTARPARRWCRIPIRWPVSSNSRARCARPRSAGSTATWSSMTDCLTRTPGWPDGVVSSVGINENFLDIIATPTRRGQAARISYRPHTAAWQVRSTVKTAARGSAPSWQVTQTGPSEVTVSGTVPAGARPTAPGVLHPEPGCLRPHRVHRGAAPRRRQRRGEVDRTEPAESAAAES